MDPLLKYYFPMLRTRADILEEICKKVKENPEMYKSEVFRLLNNNV